MKNKGMIFLVGIASFTAGFVFGGKALVGMINDYKRQMERNLSNLLLLNDWMEFLYAGGSIEQYFYEHGYKKILIYGNGYIGQRLYQALERTDINVVAIMDMLNSSDSVTENILIGVDSEMPETDCVVITPVFYFDEIYRMLREKTQQPVISIEELWKNRH